MDEIKINATLDQIERLRESIIWKDIVRELKAWKKGFNMEMMSIVDNAESTNPSTASVLMLMGDLNGRQKAVDYFISILDVFTDLKKEEIESKKTGG
jgi:hypothetical protein